MDNALRSDRVADPNDEDDEVLAVRDALGMVSDDEQLRPVLLPVGDGLLVAVKL